MDRFILWSISFDQENCDLSFFATQVQVPCINQGTQEMISEMFLDLGITTFNLNKINKLIIDPSSYSNKNFTIPSNINKLYQLK